MTLPHWQSPLVVGLGHLCSCRVMSATLFWFPAAILPILDFVLGIVTITYCWTGPINPDEEDLYLGFWFQAENKLMDNDDAIIQRFLPAVKALYGTQIALAVFCFTLLLISLMRPSGRGIVPRWNRLIVGILTINVVLNVSALLVGRAIIAAPLDVEAIMTRWPQIIPETLHKAYAFWIRQTETLALFMVAISSGKLFLWLLRLALAQLHWAVRHKPKGGSPAYNNDDSNERQDTTVPTELLGRASQSGQSGTTNGRLASLFLAHEELRAREVRSWMLYEEE